MSNLENDVIQKMLVEAKRAMNNAYARYSNFNVGACVRTSEGHLFGGCNMENSNLALSQCAESTALGNMIASGHKKVSAVLVIADTSTFCPPCGACRQKIIEFSSDDIPVYMCSTAGTMKVMTIGELLPVHFSFENWKNHAETKIV